MRDIQLIISGSAGPSGTTYDGTYVMKGVGNRSGDPADGEVCAFSWVFPNDDRGGSDSDFELAGFFAAVGFDTDAQFDDVASPSSGTIVSMNSSSPDFSTLYCADTFADKQAFLDALCASTVINFSGTNGTATVQLLP